MLRSGVDTVYPSNKQVMFTVWCLANIPTFKSIFYAALHETYVYVSQFQPLLSKLNMCTLTHLSRFPYLYITVSQGTSQDTLPPAASADGTNSSFLDFTKNTPFSLIHIAQVVDLQCRTCMLE